MANEEQESVETKAVQSTSKKLSGGNISEIGNKEIRHQHYVKLKREKKKEKKKRREVRQKEAEALGENAPPKLVPKTIESMRISDETTVASVDAPEEKQDEEVNWDIANDEFKNYFEKSYEPKVLITSADNTHSVSLPTVKVYLKIESEPLYNNLRNGFPSPC